MSVKDGKSIIGWSYKHGGNSEEGGNTPKLCVVSVLSPSNELKEKKVNARRGKSSVRRRCKRCSSNDRGHRKVKKIRCQLRLQRQHLPNVSPFSTNNWEKIWFLSYRMSVTCSIPALLFQLFQLANLHPDRIRVWVSLLTYLVWGQFWMDWASGLEIIWCFLFLVELVIIFLWPTITTVQYWSVYIFGGVLLFVIIQPRRRNFDRGLQSPLSPTLVRRVEGRSEDGARPHHLWGVWVASAAEVSGFWRNGICPERAALPRSWRITRVRDYSARCG